MQIAYAAKIHVPALGAKRNVSLFPNRSITNKIFVDYFWKYFYKMMTFIDDIMQLINSLTSFFLNKWRVVAVVLLLKTVKSLASSVKYWIFSHCIIGLAYSVFMFDTLIACLFVQCFSAEFSAFLFSFPIFTSICGCLSLYMNFKCIILIAITSMRDICLA